MAGSQPKLTYGQVTKDILKPMFNASAVYLALVGIAAATMGWGGYCWYFQLTRGLGAAGYQPPVFWGVYITTFVFWIGIGHAGTLISAILFLTRQKWRTAVARAAEGRPLVAHGAAVGAVQPIGCASRVWLRW